MLCYQEDVFRSRVDNDNNNNNNNKIFINVSMYLAHRANWGYLQMFY